MVDGRKKGRVGWRERWKERCCWPVVGWAQQLAVHFESLCENDFGEDTQLCGCSLACIPWWSVIAHFLFEIKCIICYCHYTRLRRKLSDILVFTKRAMNSILHMYMTILDTCHKTLLPKKHNHLLQIFLISDCAAGEPSTHAGCQDAISVVTVEQSFWSRWLFLSALRKYNLSLILLITAVVWSGHPRMFFDKDSQEFKVWYSLNTAPLDKQGFSTWSVHPIPSEV